MGQNLGEGMGSSVIFLLKTVILFKLDSDIQA